MSAPGSGKRLGPDGEPEPMVLASGDGLTWLEAPQAFGRDDAASIEPVMTSLGRDWIVAMPMPDDSASVWYSANGLDWESVGSIANLGMTPCNGLV